MTDKSRAVAESSYKAMKAVDEIPNPWLRLLAFAGLSLVFSGIWLAAFFYIPVALIIGMVKKIGR